MLTAFGILVLLTLCGFIAYIGDLLGRRLGKKRLSVFGLRPKHTAILLTVVTGVLIAAFTFGAALAIVPGFRHVVTRGERLAHENAALEFQNNRARRTNETLLQKNHDLSADNGKLAQANTALSLQNVTLVSQRDKLANQKQSLEQAKAALVKVNSELHANNLRLAHDKVMLEAEKRKLDAAAVALNTRITRMKAVAEQYTGNLYIYQKGEQVLARPVLPDPPADVIREAITGLLYEANMQVRERAGLPPSQTNVITLVPSRYYPRERGRSRADLVEWVVKRAQEMHGSKLLISAVADESCVKGRRVPLRLECEKNDLVLKRGELITYVGVDGSLSEGAILGTLLDFLQSQVRRTASGKYHMVPWAGKGLGEVGMDQLVDAAQQIKKSNAPVMVIARARQDTYRAGPLNVDIEVKSVSPMGEPR